jgi:hypothetical protein
LCLQPSTLAALASALAAEDVFAMSRIYTEDVAKKFCRYVQEMAAGTRGPRAQAYHAGYLACYCHSLACQIEMHDDDRSKEVHRLLMLMSTWCGNVGVGESDFARGALVGSALLMIEFCEWYEINYLIFDGDGEQEE